MLGYRTDVGTLRPAKKLADGRLVVDALITRPGIFEYRDDSYPGGVRKELRTPAEVYAPASMESFAMVPVTNGHPPKMLTAETAKKYMVGSTGERVTRDDDHIAATVMVSDRATIDAMERGNDEVSCGYACDVDETPGEHPLYGRYDAVQTNIRGNHLAVNVGRARAGRTARVRMDAELTAEERNNLRESQFAVPSTGSLPIHDAEHTRAAMSRFNQTDFPSAAAKATAYNKIVAAAKKFGIDSSGFEAKHGGRSDDRETHGGAMDIEKLQETIRSLNAQLKTATERADSAEEQLKSHTFRADKAEGQVKELQEQAVELKAQVSNVAGVSEAEAVKAAVARADAADAAIVELEKSIGTRVRERAALERKASAVLGDGFRMDDLDDTQIMSAAIKRMKPTVDLKGASAGAIQGRFDTMFEDHSANARGHAAAADILAKSQQNQVERVDARAENERATRDAWRKPLPNDIRAQAAGKDR